MTAKTTAQQLGDARDTMQHLIATNSPLREKHERLINTLKDQLAAENGNEDEA